MLSFTEENYLKTLYHLAAGDSEVSVLDLSVALSIKMPTVNSMINKLAEKELVKYEKYKPISLTENGKKEAGLIIRKHRLTEMYLVEKMGFLWDEVHEIAEQIEHIKSKSFFDKIDELLNYPTVDPHGSPIPDANGVLPKLHYKTLSSCSIDEKLVLTAVENSVDSFLRLLSGVGLKLGDDLRVLEIQDFDQSMKIAFNNKIETFSKAVCDNLLVISSKSA